MDDVEGKAMAPTHFLLVPIATFVELTQNRGKVEFFSSKV
jgi:hypothetical protein